MSIQGYEFEGKFFRSKVRIPFVEATPYLPGRVYVDGVFPAGTVFRFEEPVCSQKQSAFGEQVNDYCHAAALTYSERFNGSPEAGTEKDIVFHVDLSAFFLLLEPLEEAEAEGLQKFSKSP